MQRYIVLIICWALIVVLPVSAQEETIGLPVSEIEAYPEPDVRPLTVDNALLYDRAYRRVEGELAIHQAPGVLSDNLGSGYNFVTLAGAGTEGDWTQIGAERWIPTASLTEDVTLSRFAGVLLPQDGLPYRMAWTLRHLRAAKTPGGDAADDNPFLYRYTRVNIYASAEVDGYRWYQIGADQWVHQFNVAKILPQPIPEGLNTEKWVSVDLYEQVMIAYEGERPVFATLISSGLSEWPTNQGLFNVYLRRERTTMSGAYGQPDFYYLEEVPWTMFYDGDIALHGTYWHDGFGYRQSHGCVNLSITDAHWVYEWSSDVRDFDVEDSPDLSVFVFSSGEYD